MGMDEVSGWTLKECREQLVDRIWDVVSSSQKEGRVLRERKRANIVPICKGGKKTEPLDYRLMSLTSVGKLCESDHGKVDEISGGKSSYTSCQFGFKKERSCMKNLLSFYTQEIDEV